MYRKKGVALKNDAFLDADRKTPHPPRNNFFIFDDFERGGGVVGGGEREA